MMQHAEVLNRPKMASQPHEELQALVGRALVDPGFRKDLLNGHRRECLSQFALTADEHMAATRVEADDLATFASGLQTWIGQKTTRMPRIATAPTPELATAA